MHNQKKLVDDIISAFLLLIILFQALFNQLLAIMSIAVYPLFFLLLYGFYRFYMSIFNEKLILIHRVLNLSFGIASIIFSSYVLNLLFTQPNITVGFVIYFLGIPTFLIGLAGLLKGLIVKVYSPIFRFLNALIGAITVFFTSIAITFAELGLIFHLFTLLTTLTLNGIFRAALYLSEYGLSLNSFKNLKLVWFLMDGPSLSQQMENLVESYRTIK
jgi:hypothetical protein